MSTRTLPELAHPREFFHRRGSRSYAGCSDCDDCVTKPSL